MGALWQPELSHTFLLFLFTTIDEGDSHVTSSFRKWSLINMNDFLFLASDDKDYGAALSHNAEIQMCHQSILVNWQKYRVANKFCFKRIKDKD